AYRPMSTPTSPHPDPRWERLRRGPDIRRALREGTHHARGRVVLYVLPGRATRVAFVCGRRVGGAVVRNRARRLMREAWRGLAPGIRGGFDIVLMARSGIVGARAADVADDLAGALRAARLTQR